MSYLVGIAILLLSVFGGYKFVSDRAYQRGYDEGVVVGYEDSRDEIRPVLEDAVSEQEDMLADFYSLQTDYNTLRDKIAIYARSIGQEPGYIQDVECVTAALKYQGCY